MTDVHCCYVLSLVLGAYDRCSPAVLLHRLLVVLTCLLGLNRAARENLAGIGSTIFLATVSGDLLLLWAYAGCDTAIDPRP
ncbi:unnamed protein product [Thelazia callipaeda]|uniref:Secreted protein n=1 Tax=Thelazia callipaeda TaxID=103827 RepID=A0A0N5DC80_THECL|nr:unnamed protein product [Thelazia callipaeda]